MRGGANFAIMKRGGVKKKHLVSSSLIALFIVQAASFLAFQTRIWFIADDLRFEMEGPTLKEHKYLTFQEPREPIIERQFIRKTNGSSKRNDVVPLAPEVVPIVLVFPSNCAPNYIVVEAAKMAKKVYYVGQPRCKYESHPGAEVVTLDINQVMPAEETELVDHLSAGLHKSSWQFEFQCIVRHFVLRDVFSKISEPVVMAIDHDVLVHMPPADIYMKMTDVKKRPLDVVLSSDVTNNIYAAAYTSFWTEKGIDQFCQSIMHFFRRKSVYTNDMWLTSLFAAKARKANHTKVEHDLQFFPEAKNISLELVSEVYRPQSEFLQLYEKDLPIMFDNKVLNGPATYLRLNLELHPGRDGSGSKPVAAKRVFYCGVEPMVYDLETRQFVRQAVQHFQGAGKQFMPEYVRGKNSNCVCENFACTPCTPLNLFKDNKVSIIQMHLRRACPQAY